MKSSFIAITAAVLLSVLSTTATAGQLAGVSVISQHSGERLSIWRHQGKNYVAGNPGERYTIEVKNKTGGRLLGVVAVDGVNVISGMTASANQQGYVVDGWQSVGVDGWRKTMDEVAAFYFTRLPDAYAARTERPDNVGIIGVALFREYIEPVIEERSMDSAGASAAAPADPMVQRSEKAAEAKLGTGHGERVSSATRYTDFQRASSRPDEVITIHYDTRARLVARGVIPRPRPVQSEPRAFPGDFVPDPS